LLGPTWSLAVALVAAGALGFAAGRRVRSGVTPVPQPLPADHEHLLDLLRRAHRAIVAVLLRDDGTIVTSAHPRGVPAATRDRGVATARLALANDGPERLTDAPATVARAQEGVAVALVFDGEIGQEAADRAVADAWRLAAALAAVRRPPDVTLRGPQWGGEPWLEVPETIAAAAIALCDEVRRRTGRPVGLVLRNEVTGSLRVARISGGDQRLQGTSVLPESAVARAVDTGTPVAGMSAEELFGHPRPDRRRADVQGLAFPIVDARDAVGALVVFGVPSSLAPEVREGVLRLLLTAAPRLGRLQAVQLRDARARTDELTGLTNRRGYERELSLWSGQEAALLIVDVDFFKRVNDTLGHVAGDAALRHLAVVLRRALRAMDLAARMGGEEFALWLPDTGLAAAVEVAERVRAAVQATPGRWSGQEIPLTCSVGVAAFPETTAAKENLYAAADAAVYRAKQAGRNRVEVAGASDRSVGDRGQPS
jgi:diguanylate cyclase (GGDEF)-like protein